ncbi:MAG: hypothetical protein KIT31_07490 [Deltaproteobacteria bacterium]|nr:hypothetical protein [Deltaproteobacteria bacterium]
MAEDDRAVLDRLAALEAEVKADEDQKRARKEAALAKVREQRAAQQAERDALRSRQAALVVRKKDRDDDDDARGDQLGGALELARKAHGVKQELQRKGEKSWVKSGALSLFFGPLGWLYAGSLREAVPAGLAYLAVAFILAKLPSILLMPALLIALPLSAIAGVVYALQYNRHGTRQRLFNKDGDDDDDKKPPPKQLKGK